MSAAEHYALKGRREKRNLNQLAASIDDLLFFLKLEIKLRTGGKSIEESALENYKYMIFEAARQGRVAKIKAKAISRQLNARDSGENILLRKFSTIDFSELHKIGQSLEEIEASFPMAFHEPEVIGSAQERPLRTVDVPQKWIATIDNATVVGGFQVLASNRLVIYEPAANPHRGFVAGIWQYIVSLNQKSEILLWFRYKKEVSLPSAILLSGRCSPNYYHWLVEYLGRCYILEKKEALRKIPLIVDDGMFPQEFDSLRTMLPDWPIYRMDNSTLLKVKKLHIPSTCTNLADNLREPMWKCSAICFRTLAHMQATVFRKFEIDPAQKGHRKIFLARRSGRNITNTIELEEVLASFGYEIIDTGLLSFEQQVRLFSEASAIVGAMGAAFTNLIFCRPGTQVLALSSPYTQLFCSQSNMALFAGCEYRILTGEHPLFNPGDEHTVSDPSLFLDSYAIDATKLAIALADIEPRAN
ncbi:MAG: hypothetical protein ABS94_27035 [Variovorax sp. SCN 67-85]|nr:MAG: hypothetical protein ABS94_27035 [Variovorax sp. SCN 67-85]